MSEFVYVIRRKKDGQFFTGVPDVFSPSLSKAKVYTTIETEVAFLLNGEEWHPIPCTSVGSQERN
jgi:hypothetical protein